MYQKIEDLYLIKPLGKGAFGGVYLSGKQNSNKLFATKKISREIADRPKFKKYLVNEINIMKILDHPNIVKFEELKKTSHSYFIVMEYINGGGLAACLKDYIQKNGKAFSVEIVQYLMRQIIDALNYIHDKKIIHRDLKLDNIMVNFDSEIDKKNLNMMKAKIKIIDFGFSIQLSKQDLASTAVGSPINMDPIILEKFNKLRDKSVTYDNKADIWSIGTVCYELLIGKSVFNAETMDDLVEKVKEGKYTIPSTVSKELISFLNCMLQYEPKYRFSAKELKNHPFLKKNIKDFIYLKAERAKKDTNIKKNKSIWAIFNDEDKFINIKENNNHNHNQSIDNNPIPEESKNENEIINSSNHSINYSHTMNNNNHINYNNNFNNNNIIYKDNKKILKRSNTAPGNMYSFYGQKMSSDKSPQLYGLYPQMMFQYNNYPQYGYRAPIFGVPMPYGYVEYNMQNQYQNIQNRGLKYNYPYKY